MGSIVTLDDDSTSCARLIPAVTATVSRISPVQHCRFTVVATTADLTVAQVRLDESGLPYTWIELRPAPLKAAAFSQYPRCPAPGTPPADYYKSNKCEFVERSEIPFMG